MRAVGFVCVFVSMSVFGAPHCRRSVAFVDSSLLSVSSGPDVSQVVLPGEDLSAENLLSMLDAALFVGARVSKGKAAKFQHMRTTLHANFRWLLASKSFDAFDEGAWQNPLVSLIQSCDYVPVIDAVIVYVSQLIIYLRATAEGSKDGASAACEVLLQDAVITSDLMRDSSAGYSIENILELRTRKSKKRGCGISGPRECFLLGRNVGIGFFI